MPRTRAAGNSRARKSAAVAVAAGDLQDPLRRADMEHRGGQWRQRRRARHRVDRNCSTLSDRWQGNSSTNAGYILAGFAVLAAVIVGIILISRSGGSSDKRLEHHREQGKRAKQGRRRKSAKRLHQGRPAETARREPAETEDDDEEGRKGRPRWSKPTAAPSTSRSTTTEAPMIANSFAYLGEEGFYDELTFHRIVPEFVIQGGDPTGTGERRPRLQSRRSAAEEPQIHARHGGDGEDRRSARRAPRAASSTSSAARRAKRCRPNTRWPARSPRASNVVEPIGELGDAGRKTDPARRDRKDVDRTRLVRAT